MLQRAGKKIDSKEAVLKIKDASYPAPFASELVKFLFNPSQPFSGKYTMSSPCLLFKYRQTTDKETFKIFVWQMKWKSFRTFTR